MSALSVELSTEQTRTLGEASVRLGLPPIDAPGLELIAPAIARFGRREIAFDEFVAAVDRVGPFVELALWERIDQLERDAAEGDELRQVRAGVRWLTRFPWRDPRWRP